MSKTLTIDEAKARSLEELLLDVTQSREALRIEMPEGEVVEITPVPKLKPLNRLEGYVPAGWKDAIYGEQR
jgi:hypothetical protein